MSERDVGEPDGRERDAGEGGEDVGPEGAPPVSRSGSRARRRVAGRVAVIVVVLAAVVVTAVAVQDRAAIEERAHDTAHAAVEDLVAVRAGRDRVSALQASVRAAEAARSADDTATVEIITALDELATLEDRIALAELELSRVRQVSEEQVGQLRILHACAVALEQARIELREGDTPGATAALAAGSASCRDAEAMAEGIAAAHPFDFADPQVMQDGGTYYAFGTNGPAGTVQVLTSDDLRDWDVRGSALDGVPEWATSGFTWAPAAVRTASGYALFYTVRDRASGRQCISRAASTDPAGPYVDTSTGPLVCQLDQGGSIDPSPFHDETGGLHLTWKSEGETVSAGQAALWSAPLDPEGAALTWFPAKLLTVDRGWEGRTVEGPSMGKVGDTWILLYSANSWSSPDYATGYATCTGPAGPCTKPRDNRVLQSDSEREGPGGAELFHTADGQMKVAYAAWDAGEVGIPNPRRLHLGTVSMTPLGLRIS